MGLFDKKYCNVCGQKIGLLGNRKLEDGNLCKDCAKKLSPWFDERRHSTVEQIKAQLAYREENKQAVRNFSITRTFGQSTLLCLDDNHQKLMVCKSKNREEENPDVIDFSQVTGCNLDIDEDRDEEMREIRDKDGNTKEVSYNPPRYTYSYDFYIEIHVNHPYFDEIRFRLNRDSIFIHSVDDYSLLQRRHSNGFDVAESIIYGLNAAINQVNDQHSSPGIGNPEYNNFYNMGMEIKEALTNTHARS